MPAHAGEYPWEEENVWARYTKAGLPIPKIIRD